MLAVQGPTAVEVLRRAGLVAAEPWHVVPLPFAGTGGGTDGAARRGLVGGTGYTGEAGVELYVPAAVAPDCWRAVVAAGASPAGLGARDTLRLEAGLPLHGHELGPGITPLQAGLTWVVRFDKGEFRGRTPLLAEKARGVARRLRGIVAAGRRIPRAGCAVRHEGQVVGEVTSGNFSPVLERGIALAFVDPRLGPGDDVVIDVRGRAVSGSITRLPFVSR
jgi:aminomethyltransferase